MDMGELRRTMRRAAKRAVWIEAMRRAVDIFKLYYAEIAKNRCFEVSSATTYNLSLQILQYAATLSNALKSQRRFLRALYAAVKTYEYYTALQSFVLHYTVLSKALPKALALSETRQAEQLWEEFCEYIDAQKAFFCRSIIEKLTSFCSFLVKEGEAMEIYERYTREGFVCGFRIVSL